MIVNSEFILEKLGANDRLVKIRLRILRPEIEILAPAGAYHRFGITKTEVLH